jgi:DNA-directed RNA polymerase II subunit RPB2
MGKQAMGVFASNYRVRMDQTAHILYYAQKPLTTTKSMEFLHFKQLSAGINSIVAIACYTGYNQEDSVILNQSAIDRGLFRSVSFRSYQDVQDKEQTFCIPDPAKTRARKMGCYDKLDDDGFVQSSACLQGDDIIIGKTLKDTRLEKTKNSADDQLDAATAFAKPHVDASVCVRKHEYGIVDQVMISNDEGGNRMAKIKVRQERIPQIGDKFASRHGQKGTCGIIYRQEDLPFTREGMVPDIIINPHAIPSRMTIGHLVECLLSKVAALEGEQGDATPFNRDMTVESIAKKLHALGYQRYGNEVMYNGFSGHKMESMIFLGPTYYQRLKHMVADKMHSRARGKMQNLTRQPLEGRSKGGGLRFGEMERDCMISHGAALFLNERMTKMSDNYLAPLCKFCGLFAVFNPQEQISGCRTCNKPDAVVNIKMPYACKLLIQELSSLCLAPRLRVQETSDFMRPSAHA